MVFFFGILSQIKLLFGPVVIQLVWYILEQYYYSPQCQLGFYMYQDLSFWGRSPEWASLLGGSEGIHLL